MKLYTLTGAFSLISVVRGATYSLSSSVVGSDFNDFFTHKAIADPTNGRVNYVDESTAQSLNLTYANGDTFILRADDTTVLTSTGAGRNSVRLQSNTQYSTHVAVFSMRHMPEGCGTWPAVWEVGDNLPAGGEVHIVEGVNLQVNDQTTLHTDSGCTIPASGVTQSGTVLSTDCDTNGSAGCGETTDCDADANGNAGCGIEATTSNSYGTDFNNAGGGWYAIERTTTFIKVWFWSATGGDVPSDVSSGAASVDTDNWGTPDAYFPDTDCDISTMFGPNNIIINLAFCGDWAGNADVYAASGCPSTCDDYVENNPTAFTDAYFDFASINIYE